MDEQMWAEVTNVKLSIKIKIVFNKIKANDIKEMESGSKTK